MEQKSGSDTYVLRTITDWNVSVAAVNRTLRSLLPAYDGYECKEPEPGKFTLTFRFVLTLSQNRCRHHWCGSNPSLGKIWQLT